MCWIPIWRCIQTLSNLGWIAQLVLIYISPKGWLQLKPEFSFCFDKFKCLLRFKRSKLTEDFLYLRVKFIHMINLCYPCICFRLKNKISTYLQHNNLLNLHKKGVLILSEKNKHMVMTLKTNTWKGSNV